MDYIFKEIRHGAGTEEQSRTEENSSANITDHQEAPRTKQNDNPLKQRGISLLSLSFLEILWC